ncbi:MAG: hypothetical protein FWC79_02555 [Oscillospiraceae bacterium]|nr:hypothetical protein [Oscillospiraceae bacterium]
MRMASDRGISLIALIITIVVLLVLAGISIFLILNEDEYTEETSTIEIEACEEYERQVSEILEAAIAHWEEYPQDMFRESVTYALEGTNLRMCDDVRCLAYDLRIYLTDGVHRYGYIDIIDHTVGFDR